jgi:hypothetical protein
MGGWVRREGEEWEGPEKGCVLDYMGWALWLGVGGSRGWTEKRLVVEGFAMEGRICVSVWNRGVNLCKGRRQIWFSGWNMI